MRVTLIFPLACLLIACGCGGNGGRNAVYPVKGLVTFNGKPMVGGGSIALIPLQDTPGKTAGGIIDEEGNYVLSTYSEGDGSMPGEFRVVITQVVWQDPENMGDSDETGEMLEPVEVVSREDRIPQKYADPTSSPLTIQVQQEQNEINIELVRL